MGIASWNPDPYQRYEHRYWDGSSWTSHVSTGGVQSNDPIGGPIPSITRVGRPVGLSVPSTQVPSVRLPAAVGVGWLALISAMLFAVGIFVPYLAGPGQQAKLSDSGGPTFALFLFPVGVAILASFAAIGGKAAGAGVASGAMVGLALIHGILAAAVIPSVIRESKFSNIKPGAGFALHTAAAFFGIVAVLMMFGILSAAALLDGRRANSAFSVICVLALLFAGLAIFLPQHGFSILDIPDGWLKAAFIGFGAGIPILGWIGAGRRSPAGIGLAFGCAIVFAAFWLTNAVHSSNLGRGFIGEFSQGQAGLFNTSTIVAVVTAGIGLLSLSTTSNSPATITAPVQRPWQSPLAPPQVAVNPAPDIPTASVPAVDLPRAVPYSPLSQPALVSPRATFGQPGAAADAPTIRKPAAPINERAATAILTVDDGRRFSMVGTILVGRDPTPDAYPGALVVVINDPTMSVSKTHFMLVSQNGETNVEDLGSTNGVDIIDASNRTHHLAPRFRTRLSIPCTVKFGDRQLTITST
jgi:Protein of unknown function (DUF2510)/FHA domain